ncbi:MAG: helix-hairpin-helix domain-containing protein [Candidatus Omnitrophica bacterium]|nr:helix-hairpin-helix domain-containing protein [Candidatus Omnitrophota bacterium]MDD5436143.1 helix-hairpin-helix domain-containing protein [Candidatus Omnitrophota bacterium]
MIKLERIEKLILIFLVAALILGIAVSAFRKARPAATVKIEKFDPGRYKGSAADSLPARDAIDINSATAEELEAIKGIGKRIAGRIVEYRYQNGPFTSIDELKNVKGVTVGLFEKIKGRIRAE